MRALFAVGSDKKLKQFEDSEGAGTQMVKEFDTKILVTQISLPAGAAQCLLHPLNVDSKGAHQKGTPVGNAVAKGMQTPPLSSHCVFSSPVATRMQ